MPRKVKKPKQERVGKRAILQEWKEVEEGEAPISHGYSLHLLDIDHTNYLNQELAKEVTPGELPSIPYGEPRTVIVDKKTHATLLSKGTIRSLDPIPEKYR